MANIEKRLFAFLLFAFFAKTCTGQCVMSGVDLWFVPVTLSVVDTDRGEFFRASTTNILGLTSAGHSGDPLNSGPYFEALLDGNEFVLALNDNFQNYEEFETAQQMSIQVSFSCTGGNNQLVNIIDTNNHSPAFLPGSEYRFLVIPPVVPGYEVTGCLGEIIARDIDLTTQSIIFSIEDNDYFEIEYSNVDANNAKNYLARLRSKTLIRSIAEPITLQITATDVDLTGDPPLTVIGTITIEADDEFTIPDEPVFSQAFYTGTYNMDQTVSINENIFLQQGYAQEVQFALEGEYASFFNVIDQNNSIIILVQNPIPSSITSEHLHLTVVITAAREYTSGGAATLIITVEKGLPLLFTQTIYEGEIANNVLIAPQLTLLQGFEDGFEVTISGDYASNFAFQVSLNTISISMLPIEEATIQQISVLNLQIDAFSATSSATAFLSLTVAKEDVAAPLFDKDFYMGTYDVVNGLNVEDISLSQGYDDSITFSLSGDNAIWFTLNQSEDIISIVLSEIPIPEAVVANENYLACSVVASKPGTEESKATLIISLIDDLSSGPMLAFESINYVGRIENGTIYLPAITLEYGYSEDVVFTIDGEHAQYFQIIDNANFLSLEIASPLPESITSENTFLLLNVRASQQGAITAYTTVVLQTSSSTPTYSLLFSAPFYSGTYSTENGLEFLDTITLESDSLDDITFTLEGDSSQLFQLERNNNQLILELTSPIPSSILASNWNLLFSIKAESGELQAYTAIVITLPKDFPLTNVLLFDKKSHSATLQEGILRMDRIFLIQSYGNDITFTLTGDLSSYFSLEEEDNYVDLSILMAIPDTELAVFNFLVLELEASENNAISAHTTIVVEVIKGENSTELTIPVFDQTYYTGSYDAENGFVIDPITLAEGYDDTVTFSLESDDAQWFSTDVIGNTIIIILSTPIDESFIDGKNFLIFSIVASKPGNITGSAAIIVSIEHECVLIQESETHFGRPLYKGQYELGVVTHEVIDVYGHNSTDVIITGELSEQFEGSIVGSTVVVESVNDVYIAPDVPFVALVLEIGPASTALILTIVHPDVTERPTVTFLSENYVIVIDSQQTGFLMQLFASSSNGETLIYSLHLENDELRQRLSVSQNGELFLSAPAASGVYQFSVSAATIVTNVIATANVQMTVNSVGISEVDELFLNPLIILNRDEEEPHLDLIVLNEELRGMCTYEVHNRWPVYQDWLYIDNNGSLSARTIDREDDTIAFMALSQIQVELVLSCTSENQISNTISDHIISRNLTNSGYNRQLSNLGPYEYGNAQWILTDHILFNPRRSLVNLIINDINDNAPIFEGKEDEPIVVGYPVKDLGYVLSPRTLALLEATDADVGENAHILYWTNSSLLTVQGDTGAVYLTDNSGDYLQDGAIFTILATDQYGEGLTGSVNIMVRLLNAKNIVIFKIRNAFLEDEFAILSELSEKLNCTVKSIQASVISDEYEEFIDSMNSRSTRQTRQAAGATLELVVYALSGSELLESDQILNTIHDDGFNLSWISTVLSLEDLVTDECYPISSSNGFFISTIVLSVLLVLVILVFIIWYLLQRNYQANKYAKFSDTTSNASSSDSTTLPTLKPDKPQIKPSIEDIKRSEQRLQEMLNKTISSETFEKVRNNNLNNDYSPKTVTFEPIQEPSFSSSVDVSKTPIVIQSIDRLNDADDLDDDEFGENKQSRRKSVVTFNEKVEKIIHLEETEDDEDLDIIRL